MSWATRKRAMRAPVEQFKILIKGINFNLPIKYLFILIKYHVMTIVNSSFELFPSPRQQLKIPKSFFVITEWGKNVVN